MKNTKNFAIASLMLLMVSLTGCAVFGPYKSYEDLTILPLNGVDSPTSKLIAAITKTNTAASGITGFVSQECFNVPIEIASSVVPASYVLATPTQCKQQRNIAIVALLSTSDNMCQNHLKTIFGNEASFNILTGSIAGLTATWATVAPTATAPILSALSAFSNAERSLVNDAVYKNMLSNAITKKSLF